TGGDSSGYRSSMTASTRWKAASPPASSTDGSAAPPDGCSFLYEGLGALACVLAPEDAVEPFPPSGLDLLVVVGRPANQFLGRGDRQRGVPGDALGHVEGLVEDIIRWGDRVHQAQVARPVGVDGVARERQLEGDAEGQTMGDVQNAGAGKQPPLDLGEPEA